MFVDKLEKSIKKSGGFLCVGLDPEIETFPDFFLKKAEASDDLIYTVLVDYYTAAIEALAARAAAFKPNIAFFERYGLSGLKAFSDICSLIKDSQVPCIVDCKRGDIGNTAKSYAKAFFGGSGKYDKILGHADAITISPFLGFDTLETFLQIASEMGRGLFVLVKTSNPGSKDLQDLMVKESGQTVSQVVAKWLSENSEKLRGVSGFSGLGAVVGATHPEEAAQLRQLMPTNFFLMPGVGAQGGTVESALPGFAKTADGKPAAGLIQVSRGIFAELQVAGLHGFKEQLRERVKKFSF